MHTLTQTLAFCFKRGRIPTAQLWSKLAQGKLNRKDKAEKGEVTREREGVRVKAKKEVDRKRE